MLARVLHSVLALCPPTFGAGVGWAVGAGWGVAAFGASTFGYVFVLLTVDVFPDVAPSNRGATR